jgi:prepilin-type N-terminal cleavage/methylation domain-containing protein
MINLSIHRKDSFPRSRESGFTLIELMISMLLGLIMIAGTISVFAGSNPPPASSAGGVVT